MKCLLIVSAVMHADELNTAMTEKYGRPIYHYHLHMVIAVRSFTAKNSFI